jgi:hypothetical protein
MEAAMLFTQRLAKPIGSFDGTGCPGETPLEAGAFDTARFANRGAVLTFPNSAGPVYRPRRNIETRRIAR